MGLTTFLPKTNVPSNLNDQEQRNPQMVLASYFSLFDLHDNLKLLRILIFNTLGRSDEELVLEGFFRDDVIFFYKEIERFTEACWILNELMKKEKGIK